MLIIITRIIIIIEKKLLVYDANLCNMLIKYLNELNDFMIIEMIRL